MMNLPTKSRRSPLLLLCALAFHLCGAYQRNKARRYGLLDEQERPDAENVALITAANERITDWMAKEFPSK